MTPDTRLADPTTAAPDSRRAWLVTAAAFGAGFVVFGVVYGFGVFLAPLSEAFDAGRGAASAFFAVASLGFYLLGPVAGRLGDRLGPRVVVATGALAMGAGLVVAAHADRLWVGLLAYGLGVGLGAACAYVPTLAAVGGWFVRRRTHALGIAAAGTGFGVLAVPPLAALVIEAFGWRAGFLALGLGSTVLLAVCAAATARPPRAPQAAAGEGMPLAEALRSRAFLLMYVSWVLATTALFVPFLFLPAAAMAAGIEPVAAAALISILGGASILGRLGIGPLSVRLGVLGLFKLAVAVMAASPLLWLVGSGYGWLAAFAAILGLSYGLRIALVPAVLIALFGLRDLGALLGMFFTATGLAAALGPLIAGAVVDLGGSYRWAIVFALVAGALGVAAIAPLRGDRDRAAGGEFADRSEPRQ